MKNQPIIFGITAALLFCISISPLNAENCSSNWISPNSDQIHEGSIIWQQSLPAGCLGGCAKIRVTLQVLNYNDAGALDLYCSNINKIDYGDPTVVFDAPKLGWIGRINVPLSVASPGWKTVTFDFRLPHLEWLNDNRTIFLSLEGPLYLVHSARFRLASSTIETIAWNTDLDGDGDIDGSDLAGFIADFGCNVACAADFNGDGVVDGNDIPSFSDEHGWSGCALGFYESYNDNIANGWIPDNINIWTFEDGVYKMTGVQPPQASFRWSYYNQLFDDFSFEASIKQIDGDQTWAAGLIVRSSSALSNHYQFLITATGYYTVLKYVGGVGSQLVPFTANNRILKGYNVWNRLKVTCSGPSFEFYINGGLVKTLSDTSISSGRPGVIAVDIVSDVNVFEFEDALLEEK